MELMKAKVIKYHTMDGNYSVVIYHGNQSFRLDYSSTKRDCEWTVRMFKKALKLHDLEMSLKKL